MGRKARVGWKLVRHEDGALRSYSWARIALQRIGIDLRYTPGEWVSRLPGCGPIAVFDTLENATEMFDLANGIRAPLEMWECNYTPTRLKIERGRDTCLWIANERWLGIRILPTGTVLCDRVKLLRRVENEEEQNVQVRNG